MASPQWESGTPADAIVSARIVAPSVSIETVETPGASGEVDSGHMDDILCRYIAPARPRASATFGRGYAQSVGSMLFVPAGVANRTSGFEGQIRAVVCRFDHEWLCGLSEVTAPWQNVDLSRCGDIRNSRLDLAVRWLATEAEQPSMASAALVDSLATVIAIELSRHFAMPQHFRDVRSRHGKLAPRLVREIADHVEGAAPCPTIGDLAKLCGCTATHLRRTFKRTTGQTLYSHIEQVRLAKAKSLLADTDLSIADIATRLGFTKTSGFSFSFRKASGVTATDYRIGIREDGYTGSGASPGYCSGQQPAARPFLRRLV